MSHLGALDLIAIAAYALLVLYVGWRCARQQVSMEEYFVAGRGVGSIIVGISMIATLLSTISYLTTPGEMIKNGPGILWGVLGYPVSFAIVGYLVIPRIMKHRITSGYELLHERFGMAIRQVASVLFILIRIIWMGFIIFTCSRAVATITGLPLPSVLVLVGAVGTAYTVMGGIRAVMVTDVIQFVILLGGGILAIGFVTWQSGGFGWWPDWSNVSEAMSWKEVKVWSLNPFDRVTVASAVFASCFFWISAATSDQVMIQRYLCTRDVREARRSLRNCLIGDVAVSVVLGCLGFALLGFYLQFPDRLADPSISVAAQADDLFPHFIGAALPAGVSGLLVAALFAAAMSSLDSGITAISSVLMTDFKALFERGLGADAGRALARARWVGAWIGLLAIALSFTNILVRALFPEANLFEIGFKISEFFVAPLFVLFALAFFVPFSTPAGAWAVVAAGVLSGVLFTYWRPIVGRFVETGELSFLWIAPAASLCSFLCGVLVSGITKPRVLPHEGPP